MKQLRIDNERFHCQFPILSKQIFNKCLYIQVQYFSFASIKPSRRRDTMQQKLLKNDTDYVITLSKTTSAYDPGIVWNPSSSSTLDNPITVKTSIVFCKLNLSRQSHRDRLCVTVRLGEKRERKTHSVLREYSSDAPSGHTRRSVTPWHNGPQLLPP